MYLKNTSKSAAIIINTTVGKLGIKPNEIIDLSHKLLPPISDNLVKVTQEEYLTFRKGTTKVEESIEKMDTTTDESDKQLSTEMDITEQEPKDVNKPETIEELKTIVDEVSKDLLEDTPMDFIEKLLNPNFEQVGQEPETDALKIQETDSEDEETQLQQQIEDLKQTWQKTKTPKKKDKISKQIKELQKQLDKLIKDKNAADE